MSNIPSNTELVILASILALCAGWVVWEAAAFIRRYYGNTVPGTECPMCHRRGPAGRTIR